MMGKQGSKEPALFCQQKSYCPFCWCTPRLVLLVKGISIETRWLEVGY